MGKKAKKKRNKRERERAKSKGKETKGKASQLFKKNDDTDNRCTQFNQSPICPHLLTLWLHTNLMQAELAIAKHLAVQLIHLGAPLEAPLPRAQLCFGRHKHTGRRGHTGIDIGIGIMGVGGGGG